MTTKSEIAEWFDRGQTKGSSHLIVVVDGFDHEDYPVYAGTDEECLQQYAKFNGPNMQRVMEVYDLRQDKQEQLNVARVLRLPSKDAK